LLGRRGVDASVVELVPWRGRMPVLVRAAETSLSAESVRGGGERGVVMVGGQGLRVRTHLLPSSGLGGTLRSLPHDATEAIHWSLRGRAWIEAQSTKG
jgi:hypothetical protein